MTLRKLLFGGAAIASLAAVAHAHSGATGVVKERMEAMKSMGEAIKRIKPMMSGEAAYDAAAIKDAARQIAAEAGAAMTDKFPDGSNAHPSETLPRTWEEWDRFSTLADQLKTAAEGLALAADNAPGEGGTMGGGMMGDNMMGGGMSGSGMMGGGMMGGATMHQGMTAQDIGAMPADGAYMMVTGTCSSCHDRYRQEQD